MNKHKIINDPVYGFITIYSDLVFDIIEHPFFQRLRRIRQLGLTDMVYPGALHTRFHHALGAMHLMGNTLDSLRNKGHAISDDEYEASLIAILLHDVGHGPFSHALEFSLIPGMNHETMSRALMALLNETFGGRLAMAMAMFEGSYERKFFNQLVASQLDIDRLDYLNRDSFFTGVSEGTVGAERIIKMLDIHDDQIVVEEKGIYSIENFLGARRLMYWQVYLHKTALSAEKMLIQIIRRAKKLALDGHEVFATPALAPFLMQDIEADAVLQNPALLENYAAIDDHDIWAGIKVWAQHPDAILARLSTMLLNRRLFRVIMGNERPDSKQVKQLEARIKEVYNLAAHQTGYFLARGSISNAAYIASGQHINIKTKHGKVADIAIASDLPNIKAMSKIVKKYYLCWPKDVYL